MVCPNSARLSRLSMVCGISLPLSIHIETLANVPVIVRDGAAAFASVGTAITGWHQDPYRLRFRLPIVSRQWLKYPLVRPCAISSPRWYPDRADDELRAIVVGGAEGGALPVSLLDTPYDFDPVGRSWRRLLVPALLNCCPRIPAWLHGRWNAAAIFATVVW